MKGRSSHKIQREFPELKKRYWGSAFWREAIFVPQTEDEPDNATRFLVIGKDMCPACGNDKTALIFSALNKPEALHKMLSCLAGNDVSMTRIESRPSQREMWYYVFLVDIEGYAEDKSVKKHWLNLKIVLQWLSCLVLIKKLFCGSYHVL